MAIFKYKALNEEGKKKQGLIEAGNEDVAADMLQDRGLSVISVKKQTTDLNLSILKFINRINIKDLVIFSRQFSVMISANVTLVQALRILVNQTENINLKMIISEVADEIDSGSRLSEALAKRPNVFSDFYVSVVKSGETSGKLDEVLSYLADETEKDYDITAKVKGAMIYPIFVLSGLAVVGFIMMVFVVPKLTAILTETGGELPLSTKILIAVSGFLSSYWWLVIIIVVSSIVGIRVYIKTTKGKRFFDFVKLKLPIFGKLLQKIYLVRFTRSMNILIVGGVTVTKSLSVSAEVAENQIYKEIIQETSRAVEDGNSISSVFVKRKEIPKMVSQMMSVGEKTGKLDLILDKVTVFYTREIDNMIANLMVLMEPIIMLILGVAVGTMVAGIVLPMYNMASGF